MQQYLKRCLSSTASNLCKSVTPATPATFPRSFSSSSSSSASSSSRRMAQPPWAQPQGSTHQPNLKIYNSLTHSKVPFVPITPEHVTWYACGPTVYDDSHLGHARNYVTTDIIRRILRDYFHFDVRFVMNITDVDDKIILRGRQRHLYEEYKKQHRYVDDQVRADVRQAWIYYIQKNLKRITAKDALLPESFDLLIEQRYGDILAGEPLEKGTKPGDKEAKVKMHINTARNTAKALVTDPKMLTPHEFYNRAADPMCLVLDERLGKTIRGDDYAVFTKLTQEYEARFFQDMHDLNVLDPDEIVRVTEHGKEIAEFVKKIVDNSLAYKTADGSVYFDINAFEAAGYPYARLEPWNRNDKDLQADGEGALSQQDDSVKKTAADFALWKASKAGEPSWESEWGPGRPGWHIECSAMASGRLGRQMDIHSGGIDLAFPHHDNELAQSEAFWADGTHAQWVNYFLHMGHLSIAGSKMSKSLKNFTTIREALHVRKDWTSRSLRIVFLLGSWKDGIEITDDMVIEGRSWEDRVDNFFLNAVEYTKTAQPAANPEESSIRTLVQEASDKIDAALLDSFNTALAMNIISNLITQYNASARHTLSLQDHVLIGRFVTRLVNIFGLNGSTPADSEIVGWKGIEIPDAAKEYVYPLAKIRDELRTAAIAKSITPEKVQEIISTSPSVEEPPAGGRQRPSYARALSEFSRSALDIKADAERDLNKSILQLCDKVRDVDLWALDIYLEDRENLPALVRPVTEGLRAARREREDRARLKEEARRKREMEAKAKLEKGKLDPRDMFRPPHSNEFGAWDGDGVPTHGPDGAPLAPSRVKKLRKEWELQRKAHERWAASNVDA